MGAIAALLDGRSARAALRRSLPRRIRFYSARSPRHLEELLQHRLLDTLVLGTRLARNLDLGELHFRYRSIPIALMGSVRPEDADAVSRFPSLGVEQIVVEGIDDAVAGELVLRCGAPALRLASRADLPRLIRLIEPLQQAAWQLIAVSPGRPPRPEALAGELGVSREHLARQFGAGGAPPLKRVCDLLTVQVAIELLNNPAYQDRTVARLLEFASLSHLRTVVRRITGLSLAEARKTSWSDQVRRFVRRNPTVR